MKRAAALLALLAAAPAAHADDVDAIPESILEAPPPAPAAPARSTRAYLESATTLPAWRGNAVTPPPGQREPGWQHRLDLDIRGEVPLGEHATATYSDRLNYLTNYHRETDPPRALRNDLREAFLSVRAADDTFVDAGRINQRSGVAFGFNPTDVFKSNAVVERTSEDPRALREDRLGTVMIRGQTVWAGGTASVVYAPRLVEPRTTFGDQTAAFDPGLDRTNAEHRWMVSTTLALADDLAPEILVYHEADRTRFGANLTRGLGDATILYAEWAGGSDLSLAGQARREAVRRGIYPSSAADLFGDDGQCSFQNDLAIGFTYTFPAKVTVNLEYDYHQAGLDGDQLARWAALARAYRADSAAFGRLWQMRGYAADQQQPVGRQRLFARVSWDDALVPDLSLSGLAFWETAGNSALLQLAGDYHLSSQWSLGFTAIATVGGADSLYGSQPETASLLLRALRYF